MTKWAVLYSLLNKRYPSESFAFDAMMEFLQFTGLDGEDDGVVPFVQLERAVLRMGQVNRVVLPGMEEDILNEHGIVIDVSVPVGDIHDVLDDDDGLIFTLRQCIHLTNGITFTKLASIPADNGTAFLRL